jgi:hypothetical protein
MVSTTIANAPDDCQADICRIVKWQTDKDHANGNYLSAKLFWNYPIYCASLGGPVCGYYVKESIMGPNL